MTIFTGRTGRLLGLLALLLLPLQALAEVTASLDRDEVAMGDTLRLTITATRDSEDVSDTDLRPLMAQFEVLQRSTRSSTSIINGERTHKRELIVEITPKSEGLFTIPPMRVGAGVTNSLPVTVGPSPEVNDGATVLFDAELDRQQVYVQGQVILTLRLQQAINLDNRSISELTLDRAFVKPLEQKSFQRTVNGRPWLVHEVRYAIFPEQSGQLELPAQTFSAREARGRRNLFDRGGNGRVVRLYTEPLTIEVMPRPDNFPASATWLPAKELELEEQWSASPEQLRAGESITRTITLRGEGLQGAQLPPLLFPAQEGVKFYPDQPAIEEREVTSGLEGRRVDSAALVPTRDGELVLPEVRIPWWDVDSGQLRYAVLPQRRFAVAPADTSPAPASSPGPAPVAADSEQQAMAGPVGGFPWHWLALFSSIGWAVTLAWALRRPRAIAEESGPEPEQASEKRAYRQLLAACASDNALECRRALLGWCAALQQQGGTPSTAQVEAYFGDQALSQQIEILNRTLYGQDNAHNWQGQAMSAIIERLRKQQRRHKPAGEVLTLYPTAA